MSAFSALPFVVFGGSRRLPASASGLVRDAVSAVLRAVRAVSVGCAVGEGGMSWHAGWLAGEVVGRA